MSFRSVWKPHCLIVVTYYLASRRWSCVHTKERRWVVQARSRVGVWTQAAAGVFLFLSCMASFAVLVRRPVAAPSYILSPPCKDTLPPLPYNFPQNKSRSQTALPDRYPRPQPSAQSTEQREESSPGRSIAFTTSGPVVPPVRGSLQRAREPYPSAQLTSLAGPTPTTLRACACTQQ